MYKIQNKVTPDFYPVSVGRSLDPNLNFTNQLN